MKENNFLSKHMGLIMSVAKKYAGSNVSIDDLIQEGILGLIKAKENFKEKEKTKFTTYATFWIKKYILEFLNGNKILSKSEEIQEHHEPLENKTVFNPENIENSEILPYSDFPELEKKILFYYFHEKRNLNEISKLLNISRERVRQLRQKALRRLKINQKLT